MCTLNGALPAVIVPLTFTLPLTSNESLDVSGGVNVSGNIKMGHCAFLSYGQTNAAGSSGGNVKISYATNLYNIGGCYSQSVYVFTAPCNGIYMFSASGFVSTANFLGFNVSSYSHNLQAIRQINTGRDNLSISVTIQLSTGDTVYPSIAVGGGGTEVAIDSTYLTAHTWLNDYSFSGALLFVTS